MQEDKKNGLKTGHMEEGKEEFKSEEIPKVKKSPKKVVTPIRVLVVTMIPDGFPGMGKSTLFEGLRK